MAEAAWKIFWKHPVMGAGEGSYQKEVTALAASDQRFKPIIRFENPENEFLHALISRGLPGLLSLLLLFSFPPGYSRGRPLPTHPGCPVSVLQVWWSFFLTSFSVSPNPLSTFQCR